MSVLITSNISQIPIDGWKAQPLFISWALTVLNVLLVPVHIHIAMVVVVRKLNVGYVRSSRV